MKRFFTILLSVICILPCLFIFSSAEDATAVCDSIMISEDGKQLNIVFTVSSSTNGQFYLFKVTPDNESISGLSPVSTSSSVDGKVNFAVEYDSTDHASALYGYVLATGAANKGYTPVTNAHYINNLSSFSYNSYPYPRSSGIKGLEVQYITDAQLLGVSHTVVHAKYNDLITDDEEGATAFVYGEKKYYLDTEALTLLDYRIKSLSDAGIHIYLNLILTFDSNASKDLYYPNAEGDSGTIFAPNMSNFESAGTFAAIIHYLTERYTTPDGKYGFCGSYILGYEVNEQADSHNDGLDSLISHVEAYARYLRIADIATRSAYSEARIYTSISNRWNTAQDDSAGSFGARDFLTSLSSFVGDINYGVAINPYPVSLTESQYWLEEEPVLSEDTEYVTMKNISVLTEFLKSENMLVNGRSRSVVISEFGISGVHGQESEKIQAAAYALSYYTARSSPNVEAFIWHRHVDHNLEVNLSYGLYSSSDLIIDGAEKKAIYNVFSSVDRSDIESIKTIKDISSLLGVSYDELISGIDINERIFINITNRPARIDGPYWDKNILFDFSKSLYDFYPSDNAEYLRQLTHDGVTYMRIATMMYNPIEYMGAGIIMNKDLDLSGSDYISVKVRIGTSSEDADFALVISGISEDEKITIKCQSSVLTNKWVTLKFPLTGIPSKMLSDVRIKLWARSDNSRNEQMLIDVASISLHSERSAMPMIIIAVIVGLAVISGIVFAAHLVIIKRKSKRIR